VASEVRLPTLEALDEAEADPEPLPQSALRQAQSPTSVCQPPSGLDISGVSLLHVRHGA